VIEPQDSRPACRDDLPSETRREDGSLAKAAIVILILSAPMHAAL